MKKDFLGRENNPATHRSEAVVATAVDDVGMRESAVILGEHSFHRLCCLDFALALWHFDFGGGSRERLESGNVGANWACSWLGLVVVKDDAIRGEGLPERCRWSICSGGARQCLERQGSVTARHVLICGPK